MLIPYNVDRPSRRIPYVTYALMAINIFLFFVTVFISNIELPADRIAGKNAIDTVFQDTATVQATVQELVDKKILRIAEDDSEESADSEDSSDEKKTTDDKSAAEEPAVKEKTIDEKIASLSSTQREFVTEVIIRTKEKLDNSKTVDAGKVLEIRKKFYQIENSDSTYIMEPHYSALDIFAYRPGNPSIIGKLVGLISSMFLHGSLLHIIGNMLFLWVFGRAIEDSLGPRVYLGAYLLCGIAATLLYHITTMQFSPDAMLIPSFGASGAVMGVLGLFAPRFYRTPVRAYFMPVFLIAATFISGLLYSLTQDIGISSFFGLIIAGAILYASRHKLPWATLKFPAAYFLAAYITYSDVYPVIRALTWGKGIDTGDGTAHWAHIGGFFFGMLYAVLIGAQKEGKQEFMLEDAEKAYDKGDMIGAITYSQSVLEREPGNPNAYEVMGKASMKQSNEEEALDYFEVAVENYLRIGERDKAAAVYSMAVEKYPLFILKSAVQLAVGSQMAKEYNFKAAAETLVKIPYTFPDAPENEVALLRGAQLYLQHLHQPQTAIQLLQHFWQKYPESQWMPQVERSWKMAQHQIALAEAEALQAAEQEQPAAAPSEPSRIRPQAVTPVLEHEPGSKANLQKKAAVPPPGGAVKK